MGVHATRMIIFWGTWHPKE